MGLFSSIAGIFSGKRKKKALGRANEAYQTRLTEAQDYSKSLFDPINANLGAIGSQGVNAVNSVSALLGLGGDQGGAIEALKASPMFQSLMQNGTENVLQNASATGGLRGGNVQSSLARVGTDVLAQTIQQQIANLMGLGELGAKTSLGQGALAGDQSRLNAGLEQTMAKSQADALTGRADVAAGMYGDIAGGLGSLAGVFAPNASGGFGSGSFLSDLFKAF